MRCWGCDRLITGDTCYYSAVLTRYSKGAKRLVMETKHVCSDCFPIYRGILI